MEKRARCRLTHALSLSLARSLSLSLSLSLLPIHAHTHSQYSSPSKVKNTHAHARRYARTHTHTLSFCVHCLSIFHTPQVRDSACLTFSSFFSLFIFLTEESFAQTHSLLHHLLTIPAFKSLLSLPPLSPPLSPSLLHTNLASIDVSLFFSL